MKSVKLKNGPLEQHVRAELRHLGLPHRCDNYSLPGSPDIVLPRHRVAIFVDGDFWHGWRLSTWEHKLSEFWRDKIRTNRARDQRNFRRLRRQGWTVYRIWEHQIEEAGRLRRILEQLCRDVELRGDVTATSARS